MTTKEPRTWTWPQIEAALSEVGVVEPAKELLHAQSPEIPPNVPHAPCSEGCPGWGLYFTNTERGYEIERCDECARFASDEEARDFVHGDLAACTSALSQALKELNHVDRRFPMRRTTIRGGNLSGEQLERLKEWVGKEKAGTPKEET